MMLESGATFSQSGAYRYDLWRRWSMFGKTLVFIGLNPSTADAKRDDPTVRRCIRFAQAMGYGGMVMLNLFAYRATLPSDMKQVDDPTGGPEHDQYLMKYAGEGHTVVAAWGVHGGYRGRDKQVLQIFGKVHCLGMTKEGFPRHPLYLKKDCQLKEYKGRNEG